jgi:undecaprenyl-diphosphatase
LPLSSLTRLRRWTSLSALLAATLGLFGFLGLASEVMERETRWFDETLLLALRNPVDRADPLGPVWVEEMMRDFTALGSIGVLTIIVLGVAGFLVITRRRTEALMMVSAVASGNLFSMVLKGFFGRSRPDLVPHGSEVYTSSFPSGHSMMSAIVYLTLGVLIASRHSDPRAKVFIMAVAVLITGLVGISRVYLGVHWPTDVLAGWALGTAWALLSALTIRWLNQPTHG